MKTLLITTLVALVLLSGWAYAERKELRVNVSEALLMQMQGMQNGGCPPSGNSSGGG